MDVLVWVILAFAPLILLAAYLGRKSPRILLFGGAGWILALALRIIPLRLFQSAVWDLTIIIVYSAILAGLFEEGVRYWLVRRSKVSDLKGGAVFGLAWGIAEALIMFIPNTFFLSSSSISFLDLLPGVFERYVAVLAHVAFTFIIIRGVQYKEYVLVAITAHAFLDFIAGLTYYVMKLPVWQVEGLVALYVLLLTTYAIFLVRKFY